MNDKYVKRPTEKEKVEEKKRIEKKKTKQTAETIKLLELRVDFLFLSRVFLLQRRQHSGQKNRIKSRSKTLEHNTSLIQLPNERYCGGTFYAVCFMSFTTLNDILSS